MYHKRNIELEVIALYRGNYKERFYLREISKLARLPLKTTQNALLHLEKSRILKGKLEGKNKYFALNLENIQAKLFLLQAEIYKTNLFLETYPMFKTFLKSTSTQAPIIVFGSFAKFKPNKDSDIDLFIISDNEKELPFHLLPHKIHKVCISETSFLKSFKEQETLIKEIEKSHIILNNHSFYVNLLWSKYGE